MSYPYRISCTYHWFFFVSIEAYSLPFYERIIYNHNGLIFSHHRRNDNLSVATTTATSNATTTSCNYGSTTITAWYHCIILQLIKIRHQSLIAEDIRFSSLLASEPALSFRLQRWRALYFTIFTLQLTLPDHATASKLLVISLPIAFVDSTRPNRSEPPEIISCSKRWSWI